MHVILLPVMEHAIN